MGRQDRDEQDRPERGASGHLLEDVVRPPQDVESTYKLLVRSDFPIWYTRIFQGKLKEDGFYDLMDVTKDDGEEHRRAKKMFELLDRDDDQDLEFVDTMIFVFSLDHKMTQVRIKRST